MKSVIEANPVMAERFYWEHRSLDIYALYEQLHLHGYADTF